MRVVIRAVALGLAACLGVTPLAAVAEVALPLHIGGRVFPQADAALGVLHQWPGTYFEGRFKGTTVTIRLNDSANILNIYLDGKKVHSETKPGMGDIELGPLANTEHTIRIEKLTEAAWTSAGFTGVFVPETKNVLPAPAPSPRRIEFIGDSYTAGYGNISPKSACTNDEVWATTDTQKAFGPLTAKHFKADYRINAISGRGIVRNYNGEKGLTLPRAYAHDIVLGDVTLTRVHDAWSPQVIVIGLGTNDFSTPLNPGEPWATRDALHADYKATYVAFVKSLRARHPKAYVILMATDQAGGEIQSQVQRVVDALKAGGETRVQFLPMLGLSFAGCHGHPSADDDIKISQSLIAFIDSRPELWQD